MNLPAVAFGISIVALAASTGSVEAVRRWAVQRRLLDVPNERSSHELPTPTAGGIGLVITTLLALPVISYAAGTGTRELAMLGAGGLIIAAVSLVDDVRGLTPALRLAVHVIVASWAIHVLGYWQAVEVPFVGPVQLYALGRPLTLLWLVGLVNAYNFMDGIDGLAAGQAVVAGVTWAALGYLSGNASVTLIGCVVAAASLGFLVHNWSPARIFMGDVGSAFLGFVFAALAISDGRQHVFATAGMLVVWPFLFDAIFTFLRRLHRGENVLSAHRSHLYQRLTAAGYTHSSVTLAYCALAGVGCCAAVALTIEAPAGRWVFVPTVAASAVGLWAVVERAERHSEPARLSREGTQIM